MDGPHVDLWRRICALEFDEPGTQLTFTARLARENDWSIGFARRVVDEYRRFLFLAMVAGHEVTPSEQIDEAWHLHLVYTRSYWDDLCRNVLRRPLHHHPTRGGSAECERYDENYRRTLASYERWFGVQPPADIWSPAEIRFGASARYLRVSTARNWVVNKRSVARTAAIVGLMGLSLVGLGAAAPLAANGIGNKLAMVLLLGGVIVLIAIVWRAIRNNGPGSGSRGCSGTGCGGFWGCGTSNDGGDSGSGCASGGCGGGGCGGGGGD